MNCLVIRIFAVGNADCLLLEMPDQELGVVDFYRRPSLSEHPLFPANQCQPPKVIFVCLTHPHSDHMTGMESILEFVAANDGEFWHTVYDMAEVLELYASPRVAKASRRSLTQELEQLATLASAVTEKFPAERIRFISAEPGTSERILSTEEIDIDVLGPSLEDAVTYICMLRRVDAGELQQVDDRVINRTSAVLRLCYGENTIILSGDALSENWRQITGRWKAGSPEPMGVQTAKASHHGVNILFILSFGMIFLARNPALFLCRQTVQSDLPRTFSILLRRDVTEEFAIKSTALVPWILNNAQSFLVWNTKLFLTSHRKGSETQGRFDGAI